MKSNQQKGKMLLSCVLVLSCLCNHAFSQSWNITGNSNIAAGTNYLGTKDPNDLVFRTNAVERGRVFGTGGAWRFGTTANYVQIDSLGKLTFAGTGAYLVGGNKYAFQYSGNPNYGLYFNSSAVQYEFRNGSAVPVFSVNANTGNSVLNGTLKVGAYTLPSTDGTSGQVLKTNGAGALTWSADNGTSYTAGTGISISGTTITNTAPDKTVTLTGSGATSVSGTYPNFTVSSTNTTYSAGSGLSLSGTTFTNTAPDQTVTIAGSNGITTSGSYPNFTVNGSGLWKTTGNSGTSASSNFIGTTDAVDFVTRTSNTERMRITSAGNVGIGTTTPAAPLNVIGTSYVSLTTPGYVQLGTSTGSNLGIDNEQIQSRYNGSYSTLYLNYYGGETVMGNSTNSYYGAIAYGSNYGMYGYGSSYGGYFYNPSGIGVEGYDDGTGHGVYGYENGNGEGVDGFAFGTDGWGVEGYSAQSIGVYGNTGNSAGDYAGYFTGSVYCSGTYLGSDQKLKQNIQDFSSAMSIIDQLHPREYNYRHDGSYKLMNLPDGQHYGLIAQDVEKILPNLVKQSKFDVDKATHAPETAPDPKNPNAQAKTTAAAKTGEVIDFKAVNYTELIPIMIKGMQEQQETITSQQKQIDDLKAMVQSLAAGKPLASATDKSTETISSISLSSASLEQNVPNPLNNTTSIHYSVPSGNASLVIVDMNGKTIKQVTLPTGAGNLTVDASTLSAGAYSYTLLIDGKTIATKKMVVAR